MSKTVQNTLEKASHSLHVESETDMHYMVSVYIVPFCMFNSKVEKETVFDVIFLNLYVFVFGATCDFFYIYVKLLHKFDKFIRVYRAVEVIPNVRSLNISRGNSTSPQFFRHLH